MNVYQVSYFSNVLGEEIAVKGLPLYKTKEQAQKIADFLEFRPENTLSFIVAERYLMESE